MVTLVDGVLANGVVMIFEMDIAFYAIQGTEILSLMIQLRILSIILPIFHTHLHNPNTCHTLVSYVGTMPIMVTIVHLKSRFFDQFEPPQFLVIHQPIREKTCAELLAEERAANINTQPMQYSVVVSLAWETISEIEHAFEDKQYQPKSILELFRKLHDDVQNIHEELAEYINTPSWNRLTIYCDDDDEDYTIAIIPNLPIMDSLIMEDEHLDTILATESDELIKSSVENLVQIPNQFEGFSDSNDDSTSIDDDSFSIDDIDYISSGSPTSYLDLSLPDYEAFFCDSKFDSGNFTMDVVEDIFDNPTREPRVHVPNVLPTHPTLQLDSNFTLSSDSLGSDLVVSFPSDTRNKIFDPGIFIEVQSKKFLSWDEFSISFIRDPLSPVIDTLLLFLSKNEDKVVNYGILAADAEKYPHPSSHWGLRAFNESPMMISGEDTPNLDVPYLHFYPP
ncbi:hypothetical protein Tco_0164262 [Tanacetum coccineum]